MVTLGGIDTTALGFGCANLFSLPSGTERMALLEAAFTAGICHFDVAPMYGLGLAEPLLARFARGRRDSITIATKFGIKVTPVARALSRVQGPVRRVLDMLPSVQRAARISAAGPTSGRLGPLLYSEGGFDAAGARASLEASLRALETNYVDLLLLHDPVPGSVRSDDLRSYLEDARQAGVVRSWGIAAEPGPAVESARRFGRAVPVLQLRADVFTDPPDHLDQAAEAIVFFGTLGVALPRVVRHVNSGGRRALWHDVVGADCGQPDIVAALLLRATFRAHPKGAVLFSTRRSYRVHDAVIAAQTTDDLAGPSLDGFLQMVAAELGGGQLSSGGKDA